MIWVKFHKQHSGPIVSRRLVVAAYWQSYIKGIVKTVVGFHRHGRTLNGDDEDQIEPFVDVDAAGDVGRSINKIKSSKIHKK